MPRAVRSSPPPALGADGTIYVGSEDDNLYALTPNGALLKWKYATGSAIISSPALGADGTIYVGSNDDNLYAINQLQNGKLAFGTQPDHHGGRAEHHPGGDGVAAGCERQHGARVGGAHHARAGH